MKRPSPGYLILTFFVCAVVFFLSADFFKEVKQGDKERCVANLLLIEQAKMTWAKDHGEDSPVELSVSDICPKYIKIMPVCPSGGEYTIGYVGLEKPSCSKSGHRLLE